jgi:hypothetical protein
MGRLNVAWVELLMVCVSWVKTVSTGVPVDGGELIGSPVPGIPENPTVGDWGRYEMSSLKFNLHVRPPNPWDTARF